MQKKKWDNLFRFWDHCIWKYCYTLSLLRGEYLLSAVNRLTNSPKILHISQRDFLNLDFLQRDQWIWWCRTDFNNVSTCLPCYFCKSLLKWDFLDIDLTTFLAVHKFKNASAIRLIFFLKMFKIESTFRKSKKNWDIIFRFWDNCIWKYCYRFSLLRGKYLLSAINMLINSPKILHITQRDFFNLDLLQRHQWIW